MIVKTTIFNVFDGDNKAYIYIWLSKLHQVVYVGMTNGYTGTIGRANGHFIRTGNLRSRFIQYRGYSVNNVEDFLLLSFLLPSKSEYITEERSYREAIEYLVQKGLILIRSTLNPTFDVISWVRESPRTTNSEVKGLAKNIVDTFIHEYSTL